MPEGDSIHRLARRLGGVLSGNTIVRSDFRVPRYATSDLHGQTVTEVLAVGKHLLIRTNMGLTIHAHSKMEGHWRVLPTTSPLHLHHTVRIVLETEEWRAIGSSLGKLQIVKTSDESRILGHLGPDILETDFEVETAISNIEANPKVTIFEALLDQRNLAGIGTIFANEGLFVSSTHPKVTVAKVDVPTLVANTRTLMTRSVEQGRHLMHGGTVRQGYWVYRRRGLPCRRCGSRIRSERLGRAEQERNAFWCPTCQSHD